MRLEIDSVIDCVYEAALVPEQWPTFLRFFARLAESTDAVMVAGRGADFMRWIGSSAQMDELVTDYMARADQNVRTKKLISLNHHGFVRDTDVMSVDEIMSDPIFNEVLLPRGMGSGIATYIKSPTGEDIILHAERAYNFGPHDNKVVDALDRIRPHFARSALLSARLNLERASTMTQTLSLIGLPGAAIGHAGKLISTNDLFEALIPSMFYNRSGRLHVSSPKAQQIWQDVLTQQGCDHASAASIPIRGGENSAPCILHVVPLKGAARDIFSSGIIIVYVTPVAVKSALSGDVIRALFDLTAAETKIAVLISNGITIREAADKLQISIETVRSVLKRIFDKTGTRRQIDLARLLSVTNQKSD